MHYFKQLTKLLKEDSKLVIDCYNENLPEKEVIQSHDLQTGVYVHWKGHQVNEKFLTLQMERTFPSLPNFCATQLHNVDCLFVSHLRRMPTQNGQQKECQI